MFVRIMKTHEGKVTEKVIECIRYEVTHNDEHDPKYMVLELKPDRGTFSITKEKGNEIYIMNNDGRTIDRYRWHY